MAASSTPCRSEPAPTSITITVDPSDRKQTIRTFGASDAWACQYVGQWPDEKRNQVADWLFSKELDDKGNPKGIGLSIWRFNIGAGSADQQNIGDEWRRAECFLQTDGTYDFTKQAGQRWFLKAAKDRGVEKLLAFANSPPAHLTRNGKAYSDGGETANLDPANYEKFSRFLVAVLSHFKKEGLAFDYISPFNEPQWDWTEGDQEGCPYTNTEVHAITRSLDMLLSESGLSTKIQISEAGLLVYLYDDYDKPTRGDQIRDFFDKASPLYLGDRPNVDRIISGHDYFTTAPLDIMKEVRTNLAAKIKQASVPLEFWQSEYCILGDREEMQAQGKDTSIDPALYVARTIHHDLALANASAWHWWTALSPYDYKDGLIYVEKNKTDGKIEDSKLLWALGNYSRFIKPGAVRIGNDAGNTNIADPQGIMISSYLNPSGSEIVMVAVNYSQEDRPITVQVRDKEVKPFKTFLTGPGADEKLKPGNDVKEGSEVVIPKRSIMTLVGSPE